MEFTSVMVTGSSVSTGRFSSRRLTAGVGRPQLQEECVELHTAGNNISEPSRPFTRSQRTVMADTARTSVSHRDSQPNGMEGPRAPATAASGDEEARLTSWEQFLTTRKPIIAPDGYIPNSVIRAVLGHVTSGQSSPVRALQAAPQPTLKAPDPIVAALSSSHLAPASSHREETTTDDSRQHDSQKHPPHRNGSKSRKSPRSGRRSAQRTPSASDTKSQGRRQEAKKKSSADITKQMLRTRTRADVENITRDGGMSSRMGASMSNDSQLKHNNVLDYQTAHLAISPTNKPAGKARQQYDENMAEADFLDATTDPTTTISKQFNSKGLNDFEDDMLDVCDDRDNGDEEHLISMSSSSARITDRSLPRHSGDTRGQSLEFSHAGSPRPSARDHHVVVFEEGHASSDSGRGTLGTPAATTDFATQESLAAQPAGQHTSAEVPETWKNSLESDSQERKEADTQERNTSKTSDTQDGRTDDTEGRETTHVQVRLTSDTLNRLTADSQDRETGEAHEETHSIGIPEEDSKRDKYNSAANTDMKTSVTDYAEGADHVMMMGSEAKETFKSPLRNHLSLFLSRQSAPTSGQVSLHTVRIHKEQDSYIGEGFCYDHVVEDVYHQPLLKPLQRNDVTDQDVAKTLPVLSRGARHAQCKIPGEIVYRLSQPQSTPQVAPPFPHASEMGATSHMREYLSPDMRADHLTPVNSTQSLALALQPSRTHQSLWSKENPVGVTRGLQGRLPALACHGGQDMTSGRVLRTAEFVLHPGGQRASEPEPGPGLKAVDPIVRHQHQCQHARLAQKKMHHYTSISRYLANKELVESLTHLRKPFSWTHERARVHQLLKAQS